MSQFDKLQKQVMGKIDEMDESALADVRRKLIEAKNQPMAFSDSDRKKLADIIGQFDVRLKQIRDRETKLVEGAIKEAETFDKQAPMAVRQEQALAASQGRRGLAQQMAGIDKGASARGLLYSGLRQGAQAQAAGQNRMEQAGQAATIQNQYQQRGQDLRANAIQAQTNRKQFAANQAYQNQMRQLGQQQSQFQAAGQIGQGVGTFAGNLYGYARGQGGKG